MQLDYTLTYTFKNPGIVSHTQVGIILSTENNTVSCHGGKFYDGDIQPVLSKLGMDNVLITGGQGQKSERGVQFPFQRGGV